MNLLDWKVSLAIDVRINMGQCMINILGRTHKCDVSAAGNLIYVKWEESEFKGHQIKIFLENIDPMNNPTMFMFDECQPNMGVGVLIIPELSKNNEFEEHD